MNVSIASPLRRNRAAVLVLLFGLVGILGYFLVVFRFAAWMPEVRNAAVPNWILVGIGLTLSALGMKQALARRATHRGRVLAPLLATVNVAAAIAFAWILYALPAVPPAAGPDLGRPAPDFALIDQEGRTVGLADFRGAPLLLVFYRGHW